MQIVTMDPASPLGDRKRFSLKQLTQRPRIFIIVGVLASLGATAYILFFTGPVGKSLTKLFEKKPTVVPQKSFKNPFAKESQYVNPFDTFKSPFYALKDKAEAEK